MALLSEDEIIEGLRDLDGWKYEDKSIIKEYKLDDFTRAIGFVTQIGIEAEKADHHPDLLIHSWNKVKVTLSTHSEGGVTGKDIKLAQIIENF